ncbi:alkaline phosphatase [Bordetella genomosp. 1]|uniref:Alkaline phosphatase n=1 Tax=Bordetella genomosp. 1 TaxID=1395607 RepID=A0A261SUX8_9BORD|nr:response regulator [Bordetella genomosp. 1]OZI40837.1 alkaline phosphatase [Bordetella genomosp. 1]
MTKILLVDDQPMIVDMLSEFLHDEGYDVHTHTDGLTALQQMLELRPDLVITDFNMPGMDGGALLTAMRENAYLNETPVLILSGRPEHEVEEACQGHAAHLRKPAELTAVLDTVHRLAPLRPDSGAAARVKPAPLAPAAEPGKGDRIAR